MTARLGKHFLGRLRHNAEAAALDRAVGAGILVDEVSMIDGRKVRLFTPNLTMLEKSEAELARLLFRLGGIVRGSKREERFTEFEDEDGLSESGVVLSSSKPDSPTQPASSKKRGAAAFRAHHLDLRTSLLRRIRRTIEPPRAAEVATLLMLAQAVADAPAALAEVLRILKLPRPIITIVGKVRGFEDCFLDLLRNGLVLPGKVAVASGHEIHRDGSLRFGRDENIKWRAVAFTGRWFDPDAADKTDWRVGQAAMDAFPILGVAEHESRLSERLRRAAQLNLACGPLNGTIVGDTITAVLGEEPKGGLGQADCSLLTLSDLAIAIRPGVSITSAWDVLANIATERQRSADAGEGSNGNDGSASGSSSKTHASNATAKTGRGKDQGSGSEIIQPAKLTGGEQDRFIPRVETLTGYGEARDWSLSLQADLALWREGRLAWDEMTTKLLLAGPPGTGKTSFARALCNTLQIPLIVTSVTTWLEPGYLGDVLRCMKAAFTEAEANKPAILFVDEIDGIGKRGNASRSYDEYWTSFINQALTLLDGASKSSGVIVVGATNNPGAIDPALLRSGRLEKHIVIPRPDTEALIGILRHHLQADLEAVIASAPARASARATAVSVSEREVESSQASITREGKAAGPKRETVAADPVDDEAPATSLNLAAKQARANKQGRRDT